MDKVHGYVDHIIYQNRENGYGVLSVIEEEEEVICVGFFRNVEAGETLDIQGNYVEHPMYGMQMKAESYRVVPPDDALSMERYLGSGAIRGIGEASCQKDSESLWKGHIPNYRRRTGETFGDQGYQ